jgi:hypothetical protein
LTPAAEDLPKGRDAIGWRIAVYWRDDRTFYEGEIVEYDNGTGKHRVRYNDGENEWVSLRNERIIWRLPPQADSDDEEGEGARTGPPHKRRRLLNGRVSGGTGLRDLSGVGSD